MVRSMVRKSLFVAVGLSVVVNAGCPAIQDLMDTAAAIQLGVRIAGVVSESQRQVEAQELTAEQGAARSTAQIVDLLADTSPNILRVAINHAADLAKADIEVNEQQAAAMGRVLDSLTPLTEEQILELIATAQEDPEKLPEALMALGLQVNEDDLAMLISILGPGLLGEPQENPE